MAEQWMSIVEYARSFSVSDMTVRRRIKSGKLHAVLKDGKYYIPVHEIGKTINEGIPSSHVTVDSIYADQSSITDYPEADQLARNHSLVPYRDSYSRVERPMSGASHKIGVGVQANTSDDTRDEGDLKDSNIPKDITTSFRNNNESIVQTAQLLQFCEKSLVRINSIERHINDTYRYKLEALEHKLKNKDLEINRMRQQIEDLQTLLKMIESAQS